MERLDSPSPPLDKHDKSMKNLILSDVDTQGLKKWNSKNSVATAEFLDRCPLSITTNDGRHERLDSANDKGSKDKGRAGIQDQIADLGQQLEALKSLLAARGERIEGPVPSREPLDREKMLKKPDSSDADSRHAIGTHRDGDSTNTIYKDHPEHMTSRQEKPDRTVLTYDSAEQPEGLKKMVQYKNGDATFEYDPSRSEGGQVKKRLTAQGSVTEFDPNWSENGLIKKHEQQDGSVTHSYSAEHRDDGMTSEARGPDGRLLAQEFDPVRSRDGVVSITYNPDGSRTVTLIDGSSHVEKAARPQS